MLRFAAAVLRALAYGWVLALIQLVRALCRLRLFTPRDHNQQPTPSQCVPIDHPAFVRPDPLLYSQRKLLAEGLAVSWDNPDITLYLNGVPVGSGDLQPATTYDVQARIWNNSTDAPVVGMPVHFSFLGFGVGTVSTPIGSSSVDVGVKGSGQQPGFATVPWTTPATPGHYCLQVLLDPVDDADPSNNLGQENTNVAEAHSPAAFSFSLRNDTALPRTYRFEPDGYELPSRVPCAQRGATAALLDRHRRDRHPVPDGFTVAVVPPAPRLQPGQTVEVSVSIEPPPGWSGRRNVNVNVFHERGFAGGVTLTVTKGA